MAVANMSFLQLPSGKDIVCETDEDFEIFPGVNTQTIMAMLPSVGF